MIFDQSRQILQTAKSALILACRAMIEFAQQLYTAILRCLVVLRGLAWYIIECN